MKSHVSELYELAKCVITDAAAKCTANQLEERDLTRVRVRIEKEGLSFLTITLPTLGKDLEQALALGAIGPTHFRSFKKCAKVPAFLRGFFGLVFDPSTGGILDEPQVPAIEGLRQIAYAFKKLEVPCHTRRVRAALREFIEIEHTLKEPLAPDITDYFVNVSNVLWSSAITSCDLQDVHKFRPKHGPGATAERVQGNAKYVIGRWHERLESYFPMLHNAFSSESALGTAEFQKIQLVSEECEQPVRVIAVPKTLKAPRIIAIEPVCMQYTQQAISKVLMRVLERATISAGHVNFTSQARNRELAMISSAKGNLATLDLSSASDRVPYALAIRMFDSNPDLQGAIKACRSLRAQIDREEVLPLRKFAAMGSALCFPVESMYFYTICVGALLKKYGLPVTFRNVFDVSRNVYVYGDDIIVAANDAVEIMDGLHECMCKVNRSKSFWTGKFRESCGLDAYDGEDISCTYIRRERPHDLGDASGLISWTEASNAFYKRGYWRTASHMMKVCESYLGKLPVVGPRCAGLGKVSFQHSVSAERWNKKIQIHEVQTWVAEPVYRNDKLSGHGALMKFFLNAGNSEKPVDEKHLMRSVRNGAVALKRRWVRPY